MNQISTVQCSLESIIKDPLFKKGFKDVKKGKPFDPDMEMPRSKRKCTIFRQWNYERGRHFAYMFDGELVRNYKITYEARAAWNKNWDVIL